MHGQLNVKDVVGRASLEIGIVLTAPPAAIGSTDQDVVQMVALLSACADELLLEEPYRNKLGDGMWLLHDGVPTDEPHDDTDLILFDSRLIINALKWRFLAAKGLEFGEQMRDFTTRLNKLAAAANRRVLDLDTEPGVLQ